MTDIVQQNTTKTTDISTITPVWWSLDLREEFLGALLFSQFMGDPKSNMPVIMKSDLVKKPGDTVKYEKVLSLTGSGVSGEAVLQGNEEKLQFTEIEVTPELYRHGVSFTELADNRALFELADVAKKKLVEWASKEVDDSFYTVAAGATQEILAGGVDEVDDLDSADILTANLLSKAAATIRANNIPEVSGKGLVAIMHTYHAYQLTQDTNGWVLGKKDADIRGVTNPLFQHYVGANFIGLWDGVWCFETTRVPRTAVTEGTGPTGPSGYAAPVLVMGADAFAFALGNFYKGKLPIKMTAQNTDYEFNKGFAVNLCYQTKILEDDAIVNIWTSCNAPS